MINWSETKGAKKDRAKILFKCELVQEVSTARKTVDSDKASVFSVRSVLFVTKHHFSISLFRVK